MKRVAKIAFGWFFMVLGVIGCFLPILQGFLFMAVGLILLADESPFFKRHIRSLEHKYPDQMHKIHASLNAMKGKVRRLLHRK